ncbi:helix-turn-helix domain-containing protein [Aquamicrobium zhengzhouense]|uniref:Terminase small subunit n=1 Tax=Aquamicrobium zhengzhouense TaxID=2781738 RepID=A0ABS0SAP1_9HYPH|nr:hypothetical protein [Aquamicrobium zhengzhouense]MBI1620352.1 hypothetical protein [Aquamicrobium zhengzhouense]
MADKPQRSKGGRPTRYRPEFCDTVVELGKIGKSKAQMAAHFDVSRQTIDNWAEVNPEFLEALNRAMVHCQAWWEDQGQLGLTLQGFNAAVWRKSVEARFRDDYTERRETHVTVSHEDALEQLE